MIKRIQSRLFSREFLYFFFGGVSAFFVDFGLLNFQVYFLDFHPLLFGFVSVANLISATTAVIYNFFIQKFLAFKAHDHTKVKGEITKFVAVQVFNILFFAGLIFGIFLAIGFSVPIAKIITTVFQMISSYFLYKYIVFRK